MTAAREPDPDRVYDTESAFDTTEPGERGVPVERAPRSARTAAENRRPIPDAIADDTLAVDRAGRRRPAAGPADDVDDATAPVDRGVVPTPAEAPDDDTVISVRDDDAEPAPRVRRTDETPPSEKTPTPEAEERESAPGARTAYSPDATELRTGYAARPAAPFVAERAAVPLRMAQPPVDGEAVDRAVRGRARRRVVSLGVALAFVLVSAGCLLAALIASFAH